MKFDAKRIGKLIASIVICQLAGIIGSIFTSPAISTWYAGLQRPELSPPNWVFGPVWITLYTLMGISLFLVWDKGLKKKQSKTAVSIFGVQLFLNAAWSFLFFGLKSPVLAFFEILILLAAIIITTVLFYRISKTSAYLLIPYVAWVFVATILNYSIWMLNL